MRAMPRDLPFGRLLRKEPVEIQSLPQFTVKTISREQEYDPWRKRPNIKTCYDQDMASMAHNPVIMDITLLSLLQA